jgi:hypothetical protein
MRALGYWRPWRRALMRFVLHDVPLDSLDGVGPVNSGPAALRVVFGVVIALVTLPTGMGRAR